ncbi:MAG: peptidoglycan DL-endopeptidase CwlO [Frankiaceae bacterium]|nr:peptidoglycan DL-endopeptidase CwlO [Frankiaceae bacterium]
MPSHVLNVESSAATSDSTPTSTPRPTRRLVATRIAALAMAGAATVSLTACHSTGGSNSRAVGIAAAQAGEPYVYGATGPNAFDCSGFTQYVYRQLGKSIPRTASAQAAAAAPVPRSAARPGDLIFIGSPAYHAGIYAGGNKMWTAPKSGDVVKLQTIWSSNYRVGRF